MVDIFTENTNKALDIVAPFKTFQVKSNYKFGISTETKDIMRDRDLTRSVLTSSTKFLSFIQWMDFFVDKTDLLALYISGTYCHKIGTTPSSC